MDLRQFVIPGLGHISALVADDGTGSAAVVDPRRDIDIYLAEAAARGWRISHVLETHLHNDYVSGAKELAAATGAEHVHAAGAELHHAYRAVGHDDAVAVGALRFRVLETPGHTPEHLAYAVADRTRADEPQVLFTGGSLLVGAVGRTDLLGTEHAEASARRMHASLHGPILEHHDGVLVAPTHGGGSLCSKDISTTPWSTVGFERRQQPLLGIDDAEAFARALLSDQPAYPRYFARMRPINQAGPRPLGSIQQVEPLPVAEVARLLDRDAVVVDARSPKEHAAGHLPGAYAIPAGSSFGTWLGWVVPPDRPIVLVASDPGRTEDLLRQALRIGYESVEGFLDGGVEAWERSGRPLERGASIGVDELAGAVRADPRLLVVDVRQADEYASGHVPGSVHVHTPDLPAQLAEAPRDHPLATICASGYRSTVAASLLRQAGFRDVRAVRGGVPDWKERGLPVERGAA
jgi:hydroxyacylglutathione hydrolase